jgi:hypothetical protein
VPRSAALALALIALCAGCRDRTITGIEAEIILGSSELLTQANWVSCTDAGCRFQASGSNAGPSCVSELRGRVRMESAAGPMLDPQGNQIILDWQLTPSPGADVPPATSFTYQTQTRVTPQTMAGATQYTAIASVDDVRGC